jgi:hypothetical protein
MRVNDLHIGVIFRRQVECRLQEADQQALALIRRLKTTSCRGFRISCDMGVSLIQEMVSALCGKYRRCAMRSGVRYQMSGIRDQKKSAARSAGNILAPLRKGIKIKFTFSKPLRSGRASVEWRKHIFHKLL